MTAPPQRDRLREVAVAMVGVIALIVAFGSGVGARARRFDMLGFGAEPTYWMESAQRFRYVRMLAHGESIPDPDTRMQAPDGYPPYADTLVEEHLYGGAARALGVDDRDLAAFVRVATRVAASLSVFSAAALAYAVVRRRDAAVLAGLTWALALPMAERGTGATLFREDLAIPLLIAHTAALCAWAARPGLGRALGAGVLLAAALASWKVGTFWLLGIAGFGGVLALVGAMQHRPLAAGLAGMVLPAAILALFPCSLRYDGFLGSTGFLLCASLAMALRFASGWRALIAACVAFAALRFAFPHEQGYDHAFSTVAARLQFLGEKPLDPSLLDFHARHYWTGNYESPAVRELLRLWPPLLLAALPGAVALLRWPQGEAPKPLRLPKDLAALLLGRGPASPPAEALRLLLLGLLLGLPALYLVFRKFQLFAGIGVVAAIALGFAAPFRRARAVRVAIAMAVAISAGQTWGRIGTADRLLPAASATVDPVVVFPARDLGGAATAIREFVRRDEPVLASFIVSPFILAYLDRPTVLHCFFEGDLLPRLQRVIEAQVGPEDGLWEAARAYGARYYLHEAHHTLRTDRRMSIRYVGDAVKWPADSVIVRMSYAPESLRHFELVWENGYFRLFRVLAPGEAPSAGQARDPGAPESALPAAASEVPWAPTVLAGWPLWSRSLFTALYGDPLSPGPKLHDGRPPADLLYAAVAGDVAGALGDWVRAAEVAPFDPIASSSVARAAQLGAALHGEGAFPPGIAPPPMPIE